MKKIIYFYVFLICINVNFVLAQQTTPIKTGVVQAKESESVPSCHDENSRADDVSPAGIMAPHIHTKGVWMFDLRYMGMQMNDLKVGKTNVSPFNTLYYDHLDPSITMPTGSRISGVKPYDPTLNLNPYKYMSAPVNMTMEMSMLSAMTSFTDSSMWMVMIPVLRNKMEMLDSNLNKSYMSSNGIGDISTNFYQRIFKKGDHSIMIGSGLSLPTGSIEKTDWMPMMGKMKVPYNMQTGVGTMNVIPGVNYSGKSKIFSWGGFSQVTLPTRKNDNHWRAGNKYEITAWFSFVFTNWLSTSVRVHSIQWENISGFDPALDPKMDPQNNPNFQGGRRIDTLLGINIFIPRGLFQGLRFGVEGGTPIYQHLNGPQMGTNTIVNVFMQFYN